MVDHFHESPKSEPTELKPEVLATIIQRIFFQRRSTLLAESGEFQTGAFVNTIRKLRAQMLFCLKQLPPSAFEPTPGRQPGEEGWTAGEIISHNSDRLIWALTEAASTVGVGSKILLQPPQILAQNASCEPRLLGRNLALEVLKAANGHLKEVHPLLLRADRGQTSEGTHHGSMNLKSWLLLICIHDDDHLRQLRARHNLTASGSR